MFVSNRPWNEERGNWIYRGKVHWMIGPYITACGQEITPSWVLERGLIWHNLCKTCWGRYQKAEPKKER